MCQFLDRWIEVVPFSVELRFIRLDALLLKSLREIELGQFDAFAESWTRSKAESVSLLAEFPDAVDFRRSLMALLRKIFRNILSHKFEDMGPWRELFNHASSAIYEANEILRN